MPGLPKNTNQYMDSRFFFTSFWSYYFSFSFLSWKNARRLHPFPL